MQNQVFWHNDLELADLTRDDLSKYFNDCLFQFKDCATFAIRYSAEVFIKRNLPTLDKNAWPGKNVIIEVESPMNLGRLRWMSSVMRLDELYPISVFSIYEKKIIFNLEAQNNNLEG